MYEQAEKLVTRSLSGEPGILQPSNSTKVYIQLASVLLYTNRYEEAYKMARKSVKVEPDWEEAYNMMGKCLVKLKKYSDGVTAFKTAVSDIECNAQSCVVIMHMYIYVGNNIYGVIINSNLFTTKISSLTLYCTLLGWIRATTYAGRFPQTQVDVNCCNLSDPCSWS